MSSLTVFVLQKRFTSAGPTQRGSGRVKEVAQKELRDGGVYRTDRATGGGANSNYISRALQFCRGRWRQESGIPARKFIVLGNHCLQRGIDVRGSSPDLPQDMALQDRETVLWSVIIFGSMENLATIYHTVARCLGTASKVRRW